MHNILILGAGKIGVPIACFLADSKDYNVILADAKPFISHALSTHVKFVSLYISNQTELLHTLRIYDVQAVVSCLPYFHTLAIAKLCQAQKLHYFDLTEDRTILEQIEQLVEKAPRAFVSHCGVASSFISIATYDRMQSFDTLDRVLMRVGTLPQHPHNKLKYTLNWSGKG